MLTAFQELFSKIVFTIFILAIIAFIISITSKTKSHTIAYLMWFIGGFGILGFHRFYLNKYGTGLLWLFTGGFFGIGAFIDLFTLGGKVSQYNMNEEIKTINRNNRRTYRANNKVEVNNKIEKNEVNNTVVPTKENFPIDKAAFLAQLSQLHTLYEKRVISEEIYNKERDDILRRMEPINQPAVKEEILENVPLLEEDSKIEYDKLKDRNWFKENTGLTIGLISVTLITLLFALLPHDFFNSKKSSETFANDAVEQSNASQKKTVNTEQYFGTWVPNLEESDGLKIEESDRGVQASWGLFADCGLEFKVVVQKDNLLLFGEEFGGGNSFKGFFNNKNLTRFNNGSLFCQIRIKKDNSMAVTYIDKLFIRDLNNYLNGKLDEKFSPVLLKKIDN